jgi:F-type H+-transporting ATPase subunit c
MGSMKLVKIAALTVVTLLLVQAPVLAQPATTAAPAPAATAGPAPFSQLQGLGVGLTIIGAAWGIGTLAKAATESMARQPEIEARISTTAIILAALIEGVTLLALIILGFILGGG